ncbi:MAG TPA: creatininase family protein [Anaerolineaceae bacterium]|nr:creatininase family protein [Anaerolineaceae bacterium]
MRLDELNWMDVEQYLKTDDRLMLVIGACEQHGYLSLLTDAKIPQALADAASKRSGVLVAPPLNFGVSPHFGAYPGTISLRLITFLDVIEDMIRSVYRHGFRRLVILNGHGGNDPARTRITEILPELSGLNVRWYAWWGAPHVTEVAEKHGLKSYHAAWIEAFSFVRVANVPAETKIPPVTPEILDAAGYRQFYGDGVFGGPYQVDDAILDEIFTVCVQDIIDLLDK